MEHTKKTILLVEDEIALQEAVKLKLEKMGFEVLVARTGEEALSILEKKRPTLVWLDVLLPGMNGFEFLRKIREKPSFKDLAVIVVSVSAGPEKIKQAFSLNVIDYLIKSDYTIEQLIKRVGDIIKNLP